MPEQPVNIFDNKKFEEWVLEVGPHPHFETSRPERQVDPIWLAGAKAAVEQCRKVMLDQCNGAKTGRFSVTKD